MSVLVVHVFGSECLHPYAATNFAKVDLRLPSMTKGIGNWDWEGSGRQLRETRQASTLPGCLVAGGWRDKRQLTGCLLALRDKRACNNATFLFLHLAVACALSLITPLILLTLSRPHCIQLAIHTPPTRRVSSPQRTSISQLTNMSYRVGMYRTYDTTALATEICY
jgi:hypothetical protein